MNAKLLATASAVIILTGCASSLTYRVEDATKKANEEIGQIIRETQTGNPVRTQKIKNGVHRINQAWMPVSKIDDNLASYTTIANRVVSVNRQFANITDAASYITNLTGIPVYVNASARKEAAALALGENGGSLPPPPSMGVAGGGKGATNSPYGGADFGNQISYNGKLSGFLDILSARYGLFWETDSKGGVRLFKTKSQTFRIVALPGEASMTSKVGTQSSGTQAGGGEGGLGGAGSSLSTSSSSSEQSSGISFDGLSVWKGIEESVKTMLSEEGKAVVTPATGTITIDDTPPVLEKVAEFIKNQNIALKRQVLLNVRVLSVELNDSEAYGINWEAVYKNMNTGVTTALGGVSGLASGASSLSFNIARTSSSYDGTKLMLEALSKQGRVSQITSASVMTINNQPAPLQVGRQRSYLASSTTSLGTGGAGNTTTIQPGIVSTGFSMTVLPHILDSGKLMLQYAADISSLIGLETINSGDSSIQTPEIDTRNFLQRVMLNNGETLALAGFEQFSSDGSRRGIGSPYNILAGGGVNSSIGKSVIVVLIQPVMGSLE